jgi:hypothetical protein
MTRAGPKWPSTIYCVRAALLPELPQLEDLLQRRHAHLENQRVRECDVPADPNPFREAIVPLSKSFQVLLIEVADGLSRELVDGLPGTRVSGGSERFGEG